MLRDPAGTLGGDDPVTQRQDPAVASEGEDIVLEDDGACTGVSGHDALDHVEALVCFQPRDGRHAPLSFVQKVGGRAESTAHRAIVERYEPHGADLGQMGLTGRLARQRPYAVRRLQALPVLLIRHLFVGSAVDGIAQLLPIEGLLRYLQHSSSGGALRSAGNAPQRLPRAQAFDQFQQRPLSLAQHDEVERPQLEHQLGAEGCLHAAGNQERSRHDPADDVRQLQVVAKRHAGSRDTHYVP